MSSSGYEDCDCSRKYENTRKQIVKFFFDNRNMQEIEVTQKTKTHIFRSVFIPQKLRTNKRKTCHKHTEQDVRLYLYLVNNKIHCKFMRDNECECCRKYEMVKFFLQ